MDESDVILFLNKDCRYIDLQNFICMLVERGRVPKGGPDCRCFDCLVALHYQRVKHLAEET